jgi:hypothetical protein
MSRTLIIATTAGLLLCAAFLSLAVAIGGDDVFHDARSFREVKPLVDLATHKTWHWNGGDTLALDAPMNIRYRPSGPPGVLVTGPEDLLKHVRVGDGRIASDTNVNRSGGIRLNAVVSGVAIRKFVVNGGENLDLGLIDQPGLDLHLNGGGTVTGRGKVDQLNLVIAGPGKADLSGLSVLGDANISILGSGDAVLSPHGRVKLFIAGSGNLQLLSRPAELRQTIVGSGQVSQLAGEAAKQALKSLEISRTAMEAANQAVNSAEIGQQVQREVERQMDNGFAPPIPPGPPSPPNARTGGIDLPGNSNIDLGHIEQEELRVTISGSGSLTAEGKVNRLIINIPGSGHAMLGKLAARSVSVMMMGSGSATVSPREELNATIMGSGDVHVLTRPARIERSIMGSGHIIEGR